MMTQKKSPKANPNPNPGAKKTHNVLSMEEFLEKSQEAMPPSPQNDSEAETSKAEGQVIDLAQVRSLRSSKEGFLLAIKQLEDALAERIAWPKVLKVEQPED